MNNINDSRKYYACRLAKDARKVCIDRGIIDENTKKLDFKTLQKIVSVFGGNLFRNKNSDSYFKTKNQQFDICIGKDVKEYDESITILTGLAIPFFNKDILNSECTINISEDKIYENVDYINSILWFSKEFLMPENLYDKSMVDNMTKEGKFNCMKIAEDFGTDYMKVLARGEDLDKW